MAHGAGMADGSALPEERLPLWWAGADAWRYALQRLSDARTGAAAVSELTTMKNILSKTQSTSHMFSPGKVSLLFLARQLKERMGRDEWADVAPLFGQLMDATEAADAECKDDEVLCLQTTCQEHVRVWFDKAKVSGSCRVIEFQDVLVAQYKLTDTRFVARFKVAFAVADGDEEAGTATVHAMFRYEDGKWRLAEIERKGGSCWREGTPETIPIAASKCCVIM